MFLLLSRLGGKRFHSSPAATFHKARANFSTSLTPANIKLADGLLAGDRSCLAKSITIIESSRLDHQEQADMLLGYLADKDSHKRKSGTSQRFQHGKTLRLGFAGPPGGNRRVSLLMLYTTSHSVETSNCVLHEKNILKRETVSHLISSRFHTTSIMSIIYFLSRRKVFPD